MTAHTVVIERFGDTIGVYIDGKTIIELKDCWRVGFEAGNIGEVLSATLSFHHEEEELCS